MAEHDPTMTHMPGAGGAPTWEETIHLYRQATRIQADVHQLMDSKAAEGVDPAEIAAAVGLQLLEASTMFARVTAAASLAHLNAPLRYVTGLPPDPVVPPATTQTERAAAAEAAARVAAGTRTRTA